MFSIPDTSIEQLLEKRSFPETTREIQGDLFSFGFQEWHRLKDYEDGPSIGADQTTLFFGLGSRERTRRLIQTGPGHRLYEPDPHRLAIFLEEFPGFFNEGDWKVGTGLWLQEGFLDDIERSVVQPLLKKQYDPLPAEMVESPAALLATGGLIIQVGALFYRDIVEAIKGNNKPILPLQLDHWTPSALRDQFANSDVETLFTINLIEELPELCSEVNTHYVCWEIDPSMSPYDEVSEEAGDSTTIHTYRKENILRLRAVGYRDVEYCPLASNKLLRRPIDDKSLNDYETPVSFVGSSMRQNARDQLNRLQQFIEQQEESAIEWGTLNERIETWKTDPPDWDEDTLGLVYEVLEELGIPFEISLDGERISVPMIIAEYRAYQKRADVIETVGTHYPIDVWGDRGWAEHVGDQGTYRGEAGHGIELTRIYNASAINLDVNRIYQPNIVTLRVFDVMSCGSVVLSEESEAIQELLDVGRDVVTYDGESDLLTTIQALLDDDQRRDELGGRARTTLVENHTIAHRLNGMGLIG